jgi:hypothetical protein
MLYATIVRAHACSSRYFKDKEDEAALGRSKGGFSTKMNALFDALGNSLKFILTAGQRNYCKNGNKRMYLQKNKKKHKKE